RHHEPAGRSARAGVHRLRGAGGGLVLPGGAERGRRQAPRHLLHRHLHALRRGGHAVRVAGAVRRDERRAAGPLPARPGRARDDPGRPGGGPVGAERARATGAGGSELPAALSSGLAATAPATLDAAPAPWRSGYAAACKAVYTSSILVGAST